MAMAGTGIMNSSALPSAMATVNGQAQSKVAGSGYYGAGVAPGNGNYDSTKPAANGQFGATTALGISPAKAGGTGEHQQQQFNS